MKQGALGAAGDKAMDWRWAAACVQRSERGHIVSPRAQLIMTIICQTGVLNTAYVNGLIIHKQNYQTTLHYYRKAARRANAQVNKEHTDTNNRCFSTTHTLVVANVS